MNLRFSRNKKVFIFTKNLLLSHKTPADFMNYLRFLAAFFILSVCFSCKTKEVKPNASKYVKIPDINFEKALIELNIDDVQDGQILIMNTEKEDSLDIYNKKIKSLEGIEAFKNLSLLNCFFNELTNLDVSKNLNLKAL
jgi:Leucine-rich repeat (LRR) protein